MREGWTYKRLGEVCEVEYGTRVVKQRDGGNVFPVYGGGGATFKMDVYNRENRVVVSRFAMSSKCTRMVKGKFYLNDSGLTLKSNSNSLLQIYLDTCILALNDKIYTLGRGVAQKNLKVDDLLRLSIPIPTHERQQSIVAELDKINELIGLKKSQLSDLDSLAQSIFYEMFGDPVENEKGWEVKKLGTIAECKNGLNFSKNEFGFSCKFLGVSDFQDNRTIYSNSLSEIHLTENISEEYMLQTGDIVFVRSNGSKELVGRNVLIKVDEPTTFSGFCIRCRLANDDCDTDYLSYLLKAPSMRPIITNSGRGCNISNLNQTILSTLPIISPPLPLQQSFAVRIAAIEQQKQRISTSIKDLETLLSSRMQYWFD